MSHFHKRRAQPFAFLPHGLSRNIGPAGVGGCAVADDVALMYGAPGIVMFACRVAFARNVFIICLDAVAEIVATRDATKTHDTRRLMYYFGSSSPVRQYL